jgi:uncharacterized membrane protein
MIPIQHIHPMLVHFPIVFFLTLAGFDIIAVLRGANVTGRSAVGSISTGLALLAGLSALAAWFFGDIAMEVAQGRGLQSAVADIHEGLGSATAAAFTVWALVRAFTWWRNWQATRAAEGGVAVIELLGVVLVIATAYFGGELVFGLGVNVAQAAGG